MANSDFSCDYICCIKRTNDSMVPPKYFYCNSNKDSITIRILYFNSYLEHLKKNQYRIITINNQNYLDVWRFECSKIRDKQYVPNIDCYYLTHLNQGSSKLGIAYFEYENKLIKIPRMYRQSQLYQVYPQLENNKDFKDYLGMHNRPAGILICEYLINNKIKQIDTNTDGQIISSENTISKPRPTIALLENTISKSATFKKLTIDSTIHKIIENRRKQKYNNIIKFISKIHSLNKFNNIDLSNLDNIRTKQDIVNMFAGFITD